jgi:hypothetical protein
VPGGTDDSYGIEVAKLAGIPNEVIARAKVILAETEARARAMKDNVVEISDDDIAITLDDCINDSVIDDIRAADLNNMSPFEAMALATPLSCLQKHKNSLFQITAILLGQSGLLEGLKDNSEEYGALWKEYCFMQKKFLLQPISPNMWKKGRMRPQNAPEARIRQFAHLLYQSEFLFAAIIEERKIDQLVELLSLKYGDESIYQQVRPPMPLGRKSIEILLINTIIPYKYAYAYAQHGTLAIEQALSTLEQIPNEDNSITRQWSILGQHIASAADTQALIHLYQNYCQPHLCFNCQVGYQVFAHKQLELF